VTFPLRARTSASRPAVPPLHTFLSILAAAVVTFAASSAHAGLAIHAARATSPVNLDGRLDEAAWDAARPFTDFVESFPRERATPTQRTVVKVLYDDAKVYIGIVCHDDEPALIEAQLGRRDSIATADLVEVEIDPTGDRRTGYYFSVTAAGVQRDALIFADTNLTDTWDAVWPSAVARRKDGWSVELAIPLAILRFPKSTEQHWGFLVRRKIPRTHQIFDSSLVPQNANALVSMFGELDGLLDLTPKRNLELTPYIAARASMRPQYSDPSRPTPRIFDPTMDIGIDLRASLASDMVLNATLNPDFGQVEADQLIQNLSTFEQFYPEKRPFFNQGLELFQPVGYEYGPLQQLFYSRRIGLRAPIFGAAKLTGTARNGLEIGVLDAVVMGDGDPSRASIAYKDPTTADLAPYEARPDRRVRIHGTRPFHFGPNDELPAERSAMTNFLAAVARQKVGDSSSVGAMVTAATPLEDRCHRSDFSSVADYASVDCHSLGANVGAVDWNLRSAGGTWVFYGQADVSKQVGGPTAGRTLRDGTVLLPGDTGFGTYMRAGKLGGEPFRFDLNYDFATPKLDMNAVGFQPFQNSQGFGMDARVLQTTGIGKLHKLGADLNANLNYTTDGHFRPHQHNVNVDAYAQLPGFQTVQLALGFEQPGYDVREINKAGVPYQRRGDVFVDVNGNTDLNKPLSINGDAYTFRSLSLGPVPPQTGYGAGATVIWRPEPRVETQVGATYNYKPEGARWVDSLADGRFIFGVQNPEALSVTLRQQVVLTRALTLQGYLQLYSEVGRYGPFYEARSAGGATIYQRDLKPTLYTDTASGHTSALNVNLVMRWEYRLGSTFFAVYAHQQAELGTPDGAIPSRSVAPFRLTKGPATDTFMIKWAYWFTT
jgi:hypothetical protein